MSADRFRFRAIHKARKKMYEVNCIDWTAKLVCLSDGGPAVSFEEVDLIQSTGLPDNKNKEVFAKDIVVYGDRINHKIVIEYFDGAFGHFEYGGFIKHTNGLKQFLAECEVIGNCFENKELLEVKL